MVITAPYVETSKLLTNFYSKKLDTLKEGDDVRYHDLDDNREVTGYITGFRVEVGVTNKPIGTTFHEHSWVPIEAIEKLENCQSTYTLLENTGMRVFVCEEK